MKIYERLGLTGAIGSIDTVHVHWEMCPFWMSNLCKGKEKKKTLGYECICDHHQLFMAVTSGFNGAENDQTIVKYDKFVVDLRNEEMFSQVEYTLYDTNGERTVHKIPYLICDGGYLKWKQLMTGFKYFSILQRANWSVQMESTRKDIERSFGQLKGRFRCLKLPILFHRREDVDNMFFMCTILHNMIKRFDGLDRKWEDVHWDGIDGEIDQEDVQRWSEKSTLLRERVFNRLRDHSYVGRRAFVEPIEPGADPEFYTLQNALVDNYDWLLRQGRVEWLN